MSYRSVIKKMLSLILVSLLLLSLAACSEKSDDMGTKETTAQVETKNEYTTISLPYSASDTLDPYKAKSLISRSLTTLLYDSLFRVSNTFEAEELMAANHSSDGLTLLVTLKRSLKFSDGSEVSADDVVYSFKEAKKSAYYSARLSGFSSARSDGGSIIFELSSPNPNAIACLDFAIVKNGSSVQKYDSDKLDEITLPIGSGRYTLSTDKQGDFLLANSSWSCGTPPKINEIRLFDLTDSDGIAHGLEIGNYDAFYTDLSSGNYTRINASTVEVPTSSMVFLGCNSTKTGSALAEPAVRRAISMLINREEIANVGFQGHAVQTLLPLSPAWAGLKGVKTSTLNDVDAAVKLLENAGFTRMSKYGYRYDGSRLLKFNLAVSKDNEFKAAAADMIVKQLAKAKITVTVKKLKAEDFATAVENGEFDLYLGEVKLTADMSLSGFFGGGTTLSKGIPEGSLSAAEYGKYLSGEADLQSFATAFENEVPFVPLCFRNGIFAAVRNIGGGLEATDSDNYLNAEDWTISEGKK